MSRCECMATHVRRRIVLTGGPGAGKTAVLDAIRATVCEHIRVLPEAAGVVFGGGFPREATDASRRAAQRAIYYVQLELEAVADAANPAIVLCDRGTVDGAAYWPAPGDLWSSVGTTRDENFGRYDVVIHLRTPDATHGYGQQNPLRVESSVEAKMIDARLFQAWDGHPRRFEIGPEHEFHTKARRVLEIVRAEVPDCCRKHFSQSASTAPQNHLPL